ncbi:MAG: SDR family NAD(P)-dependent oxidoreductase [Candidatus Tectomicrobia bacterium]|nr:SDR family NAD(P)-dependent oxidoreductase [Candidatus Tectomicrobia bacterium]
MPKAIVIGASSGIGRALARLLAERGYAVGLTGRRVALLRELSGELPGASFVKEMDLAAADQARQALRELLQEMGDVDMVVVNAGVRLETAQLAWEAQAATIAVNVAGFVAMADEAYRYFRARGRGHLVGVSSIAGLRGRWSAPVYNASKAFVSTYLEGLRQRFQKQGAAVWVTDVRPGLVDTPLVAGRRLVWAASPETAARQMLAAIMKRRRHVYVTRRWRLVAWLMKLLPAPLYDAICLRLDL